MEHLFDIAALEDHRFERPGVIVRIGMRLLGTEAVQDTTVIEMELGESARHALYADDRRTGGNMPTRGAGYSEGHWILANKD